jgi:hypothetical protein
VLWASMPEAAIDEDGHLLATKDDVSSAAQARYRPYVDSVSKTAPMKFRSESKLGARVTLAIAPHGRSDRGRRGWGCFGNDGDSSLDAHSIGGSF